MTRRRASSERAMSGAWATGPAIGGDAGAVEAAGASPSKASGRVAAAAPWVRQATIIGQSVSTKAAADVQTATVTAATTQGRVPAFSITNV